MTHINACKSIPELQVLADAARRKDDRWEAALLPALDDAVPRAVFIFYDLDPETNMRCFVRDSAVCLDPYSGAVLNGPMPLSRLGDLIHAELEPLAIAPTRCPIDLFVLRYQLICELQPRVWHRFLSGDASAATAEELKRFGAAWRGIVSEELAPHYAYLSGSFEAWLMVHG